MAADNRVQLGSAMAPNMTYMLAEICQWLCDDLPFDVVFLEESDWQEQMRLFASEELDAIWICGLPYVRMADQPDRRIELLAAPIMAGQRYRGRPIYFSDVVARADAEYRSFEDLRGCRWSYNEPGSHSGYNLVRAHLARIGEEWSYFDEVVQAGSHQRSLELILEGEIDASAVDTTVIDEAARRDPGLRKQLKVLTTLGPSPIPPLIVRRTMRPSVQTKLRSALLGLASSSPARRARLEAMGLKGFVAVRDEDYDPIREMDREAAAVAPIEGAAARE